MLRTQGEKYLIGEKKNPIVTAYDLIYQMPYTNQMTENAPSVRTYF